jgi:hypothetical protein
VSARECAGYRRSHPDHVCAARALSCSNLNGARAHVSPKDSHTISCAAQRPGGFMHPNHVQVSYPISVCRPRIHKTVSCAAQRTGGSTPRTSARTPGVMSMSVMSHTLSQSNSHALNTLVCCTTYWWLDAAPSAACSGQYMSHRATIGKEASIAFFPAEMRDGMCAYRMFRYLCLCVFVCGWERGGGSTVR